MEKKSKARELALEFAKALEGIPPERFLSDCRRPLSQAREGITLRELWFEDLYASRGAVAHGRPGGIPRPLWTLAEQLLLVSYIFPRLAYQRCVLCYDANACTFQTRKPDDDVLSECDYETSPGDSSERDACFDKVNAAAEK